MNNTAGIRNDLRLSVFCLAVVVAVAGCTQNAKIDSSTPVPKRSVLTLTDSAVAEFVRQIALEPTKHVRIRVEQEAPPHSKSLYAIGIDEFLNTTDIVDESHGFKLVIDRRSARYLDGATIDWRTQANGREGFKIDNPNAKPTPSIPEHPVVTLTDAAAAELVRQIALDPTKLVRIRVEEDATPYSDSFYAVVIDDSLYLTDIVDESYGFKLVIDPRSARYLNGTTIDWRTQANGRDGFKFDNPNAKPTPPDPRQQAEPSAPSSPEP